MQLQGLKLLHPTVMSRCIYKKIQYLTLMPHEMLPSQCSLYHMTCAPENFEVAVSNGLEEDALHKNRSFNL